MSGVARSGRPLLEARSITHMFPPIVALDNVDFTLHAGEIHTLAGENGSGKSTLLKVLSGSLAPDRGSVAFAGRPIPLGDVRSVRAAGIALVTQEGSLMPDLTVAENILMGRRHVRRRFAIDWRATRRRAAEVLASLELDIDPGRPVAALSTDVRQMVEIARAISSQVRVLLLDEPTSSLDIAEVEGLFKLLRRLRAQGVGIVFVSHRMAELIEISDRVTVLRDGCKVSESPIGAVDEGWLVRNMVGRDLATFHRNRDHEIGDPVLRVSALGDRAGRVRSISFELHAGEIVGLAGLVGAGRTELLETIIGARGRASGTVAVNGHVLTGGPREALRAGIALLTEDRKANGALPEMSLRDNLLLSGTQPALQIRRRRSETRSLEPWFARLAVRGGTLNTSIGALSGGNQQKILFGRAMVTEPRVLLLDEPTRGIDIAAKAEIGRLIAELAAHGAAVLMASSELPEILAIADRVLVMLGGRLVSELNRDEMSEELIVKAAVGAEVTVVR